VINVIPQSISYKDIGSTFSRKLAAIQQLLTPPLHMYWYLLGPWSLGASLLTIVVRCFGQLVSLTLIIL
jgi:hypothetical protein